MLGPGARVANYRILKELGTGGMGIVYLAEHTSLGRKVALKVLRADLTRDADSVYRFLTEARAVNQIGHEHIVDVTDIGTAETGQSYFVMELLAGESLATRLAREGRWPMGRALHVAIQVADALAASHQAGV